MSRGDSETAFGLSHLRRWNFQGGLFRLIPIALSVCLPEEVGLVDWFNATRMDPNTPTQLCDGLVSAFAEARRPS